MSIYDAQLNNKSNRGVKQYTDLDLFFGKKSSDRDVSEVSDIQAVKRSIRNLVLLNTYEKPFHPEISSGIQQYLFDPMNDVSVKLIEKSVETIIQKYEPRVDLVGVVAEPDYDRNSYTVTVEFYVVNAPTELVDLTIFLERLR